MLAPKLPDLELAINTRDWPQVNRAWGHTKAPVFSFSKVNNLYDSVIKKLTFLVNLIKTIFIVDKRLL